MLSLVLKAFPMPAAESCVLYVPVFLFGFWNKPGAWEQTKLRRYKHIQLYALRIWQMLGILYAPIRKKSNSRSETMKQIRYKAGQ